MVGLIEEKVLQFNTHKALLAAALDGDWPRWERLRNDMPDEPWMTRTHPRSEPEDPAFTEADAPLVGYIVR